MKGRTYDEKSIIYLQCFPSAKVARVTRAVSLLRLAQAQAR